jgi:hypothetical protein
MTMEKNRKILKQALKNLPEYKPEEQLWSEIAKGLDQEDTTHFIGGLKQFDPPEEIWQNIDRQLSRKESGIKSGKYLKLISWSLAAGAILVLGVIIFSSQKFHLKNLHYSEEWLTLVPVSDSTEYDSLAYRRLAEKCESKPEVCQSGEFLKLRKELDFLDQSKQTIINQTTPYDSDNDMQVMLERIDAERTEILDRLMAYADR